MDFAKINLDLPVSIDKSFEYSLRTRLVNQTSSSWEYMFGSLEAYQQENGNCSIPEKTGHFYTLDNWIKHQRVIREILSKERIEKIESISGWSWSPQQDQWDSGISAFKEYIVLNGIISTR